MERLLRLLRECDIEDAPTGVEETIEGGHIARLDAPDLLAHRPHVGGVAEGVAVVEAHEIERIERAQRDIVGEPLTAQLPKILEEIGRGDDGRTAIEGVTVAVIHVGASTGSIELLEDRDAIAAHAQTHRGCQPAEPATDDDRMLHGA